MVSLTSTTLDEWLDNFEAFNYAFKTFCVETFRTFSVHAEFIPGVLAQIHMQWKADCEHWLKHETDPNTTRLSEIKIISLLMNNLCSEAFLGNMSDHEYKDELADSLVFTFDSAIYDQVRRDLVDAREAMLALCFCFNLASWVEVNRIDRVEPFYNRMTVDMRHDMLSYLLSDKRERKALYLIVKALFLRTPLPNGTAN
jgi:hypothetical protein